MVTNKIAQFSNTGMSRDVSISKVNNLVAFENHNIRITEMDDNTLMSVTNEKGTAPTEYQLLGKVVGSCVIGKSLVLFTWVSNSEDNIYVLEFDDNGNVTTNLPLTPIYTGNLNLDKDVFLETIGIYETDGIQKVYWTDGINQPRMINIKGDFSNSGNNTQFDFLQQVDYVFDANENEYAPSKIDASTVISSSGQFPSGTIQYFYTLSKRNGQETAIIAQSAVLGLTSNGKAVGPDKTCHDVVKVSISNINNNFDYINLYSILRTSLDTQPQGRLVGRFDLSGNSMEYIDDYNGGEAIDAVSLQYKGGEYIKAKTMAHKDNALFLGNITLASQEFFSKVKEYVVNNRESFEIENDIKNTVVAATSASIEDYNFYIDNGYKNSDSNKFKYFRHNNYYRFAIQFRDKFDKWSEPIWIGDEKCTNRLRITTEQNGYSFGRPTFKVKCPQDIELNINSLSNGFYKSYRILVAFPDNSNRVVLAQGVLNPTMFNPKDRISGASMAEPSWFYRTINSGDSISAWRHYKYITSSIYEDDNNTIYTDRNGEIECQYGKYYNNYTDRLRQNVVGNGVYPFFKNYEDENASSITDEFQFDTRYKTNDSYDSDNYALDYNILTFNSPDIQNLIDNTQYDCYVVGEEDFENEKVTIDATVETAGWEQYSHFIKTIQQQSTDINNYDLYLDGICEDWIPTTTISPQLFKLKYTVFPWNKNGSLNSSYNGYDGNGNEMHLNAKLTHKIFAKYMRFGNMFMTSHYEGKFPDKTTIHIFTGDTDFAKIKSTSSHLNINNGIYRGNLNTIVGPYKGVYPVMVEGCRPLYYEIQSKFADANIPTNSIYAKTLTIPIKYSDDDNDIIGTQKSSPCFSDEYVQIKFKSEEHAVITIGDADYESGSSVAPAIGLLPVTKDGAGTFSFAPSNTDTDTQCPWLKYENNTPPEFRCGEPGTMYQIHRPAGSPAKEKVFIGEIRNDSIASFGDTSEYALQHTSWIPCSDETLLSKRTVKLYGGDTYYQRWDSLKTYPYTNEDVNSVICVGSFMIETYTNLCGRYDDNVDIEDYEYVNPQNFNLFNDAWNQQDNFMSYRITDQEKISSGKFPNQFTWSLSKQYGEIVDSWTTQTLASIYSVDGDKGEIQAIRRWNNELLGFQDTAIFNILYNTNSALTTTTGLPVVLGNSGKVDGVRYISNYIGCTNRKSIVGGQNGLYFIDNLNHNIMMFSGEGLINISSKLGFDHWLDKELKYSDEISFYDSNYNDVYFKFKDTALLYSEKVQQFTTFADYQDAVLMTPIKNRFISFNYSGGNSRLWYNHEGGYTNFYGVDYPYFIEYRINSEPGSDKTFNNIEYISTLKDVSDLTDSAGLPFNRMYVSTDYQHANCNLSAYDNQKYLPNSATKRFRIWRANIPRAQGTMDRMRGPWMKLKLIKEANEQNRYKLMEFHNLLVRYSE